MRTFITNTEINGIYYKDSSGTLITVHEGYTKDVDGVNKLVWQLSSTPTEPSSGIGDPDTPTDGEEPGTLPADQEIYPIFGLSLNMDSINSTDNAEQTPGTVPEHIVIYCDILLSRMAAYGHVVPMSRESIGAVVNVGGNFSLPSWFNPWFNHTISQQMWLLIEPLVVQSSGLPGATAGTMATQAGFTLAQTETALTTFLNNVKYNLFKKFSVTSIRQKTKMINTDNENDWSTGREDTNPGCLFIRDFPASERYVDASSNTLTTNAKKLSWKRQIAVIKATWEQIRATSQLPSTAHEALNIALFGFRYAASSRTAQSINQQIFHSDIMFEYDGEVLSYLDGLTVHMHIRVHEIGTYLNQPPADNVQSFYHIWKVLEEANVIRQAAGKAVRRMPVMTDEAGLGITSPSGGTWDEGTTIYTASYGGGTVSFNEGLVDFRKYRAGALVLDCVWFGLSYWVDWVLAYSGAGEKHLWRHDQSDTWATADGGDGLGMEPFKDWPDRHRIWDYKRYDINLYTPQFPNKTWQEYHLPYTWVAWLNTSQSPTTGGYSSGLPPYTGWENITFEGNVVTMTALKAVPRNLIVRPVWLRKPSVKHKCTVEINFPTSNASARAKWRVRGFHKLDGLANLEVEVTGNNPLALGTTWFRASIAVSHVGHGLSYFDCPNYVALCCDHNGVGTVRFRNPTIEPIPQ